MQTGILKVTVPLQLEQEDESCLGCKQLGIHPLKTNSWGIKLNACGAWNLHPQGKTKVSFYVQPATDFSKSN